MWSPVPWPGPSGSPQAEASRVAADSKLRVAALEWRVDRSAEATVGRVAPGHRAASLRSCPQLALPRMLPASCPSQMKCPAAPLSFSLSLQCAQGHRRPRRQAAGGDPGWWAELMPQPPRSTRLALLWRTSVLTRCCFPPTLQLLRRPPWRRRGLAPWWASSSCCSAGWAAPPPSPRARPSALTAAVGVERPGHPDEPP